MQGYIKIYRSMLDHPIVNKDPDHLAVWIYLLVSATHKNINAMFGGKKITLCPGQLIATIPEIAEQTKVSERKCRRIIDEFIFDSQIGRQKSNRNSLFTVLNWDLYQIGGSQKGSQGAVKGQSGSRGEMYINNNNKYIDKNVKNVRSAGARTRKSNLNNYSQRNYDWKELERKLTRRD